MSDSRTVRARVNSELAGEVDAAMEREGRTESDVVRRALKLYLTPPADYSGVIPRTALATIGETGVNPLPGGKEFRGPDPRKRDG